MKRVLLGCLLLAGCSLPLPSGVHVSKDTGVVDSDPGDIQVMPPGPQAGAAPEAVVRGFLGAESSPEGEHAIARRFLTAGAHWEDSEVAVYDPASLRIDSPPSPSGAVSVTVTFRQLGAVDEEGRYSASLPTDVTEVYPLKQDAGHQWRISDPPRGVRLTPADRERSFPARRIYFLSRSKGSALHVVPDQVLVPVGGPPAKAELSRLLAGPSSAIKDSVTTGFPPGTRLVSVDSHSAGIYDVALSSHVRRASDLQRQSLSAQLVWTLRSLDPRFRGLRVLSDGQPLPVPGEGSLQRPDDWGAFDPEGVSDGPAYFLAGGVVRTLVATAERLGPVATRGLPARSVVVTPDRSRIAVLQAGGVRLGPVDGQSLPVVVRDAGLVCATWGTGQRGLWLLDRSGRVRLLDPSRRSVSVPVPGAPGPISWLAISRDGVRAALVVRSRLYVGRITPEGTRLAIEGATPVTPTITDVTRVAWRDPTSLVVLGTVSGTFVPAVVAVDGSSVRPQPVAGLPARATEVAASSLGVLVRAGDRLYALQKGNVGFRPGPKGTAPAYPG